MPNTTSAKKALRQSNRKRAHNLYWKRRVRSVLKNLKKQIQDKSSSIDIIKKEESLLYKVVDKAAKENVIHKNKAKRIKSSISKQVSAHEQSRTEPKKSDNTKPASKAGAGSKSSTRSKRTAKSKSVSE
jgi:small subunit ribosomal protein S20